LLVPGDLPGCRSPLMGACRRMVRCRHFLASGPVHRERCRPFCSARVPVAGNPNLFPSAVVCPYTRPSRQSKFRLCRACPRPTYPAGPSQYFRGVSCTQVSGWPSNYGRGILPPTACTLQSRPSPIGAPSSFAEDLNEVGLPGGAPSGGPLSFGLVGDQFAGFAFVPGGPAGRMYPERSRIRPGWVMAGEKAHAGGMWRTEVSCRKMAV